MTKLPSARGRRLRLTETRWGQHRAALPRVRRANAQSSPPGAQPRLTRETAARRVIAEKFEHFDLVVAGGIEQPGSFENVDAARAAARASTGELHGRFVHVAKIDEKAAIGRVDDHASVGRFEDHLGHGDAGLAFLEHNHVLGARRIAESARGGAMEVRAVLRRAGEWRETRPSGNGADDDVCA